MNMGLFSFRPHNRNPLGNNGRYFRHILYEAIKRNWLDHHVVLTVITIA